MNNTVMFKEITEQNDRISDCYNHNNSEIKSIAQKIKDFKPQNIFIVGRGTSMHVGIYAKHIFELYYHIPVTIAAQSIFTIYDSTIDLSRSLVIGISQSGQGRDTLEVIKRARKSGALILSIVNELESNLALASDNILYCNAGKAVAYAATKTFVTSLYLVTKLAYELTGNSDLNIDEAKLQGAINYSINNLSNIKNEAQKLVGYQQAIVLGRGISLPLAMEISLKMKEACHMNVNAFPLSEFYHGPIAILSKDIPVVLFDIEPQIRNDVKNMLKRLNAKEVPTIVISNDETSADRNIEIKSQFSVYSFFEAAVTLQLFTCELAVLKGYNPDYNKDLDDIDTF